MYKLAIRRQWFLFVGSLLFFLGLVIFLPSYSADKVIKVPLAAVLIGEIIIASGFALLFYRRAPFSQIVQAGFTFLALSTGIGAIGNLSSQVNQVLPGAEIVISWIQLGIMNIGGFLSTCALYKGELSSDLERPIRLQEEAVRHAKPPGRGRGAKTPIEASIGPSPELPSTAAAPAPSLRTNLATNTTVSANAGAKVLKQTDGNISSSVVVPAPQEKPAPVPILPELKAKEGKPVPDKHAEPGTQEPAGAANSLVAADPLAIFNKANTPVQQKPVNAVLGNNSPAVVPEKEDSLKSQRITNQRIQVQSKRNTGTFTKLQALSSTGRRLGPDTLGSAAEGLKAILDRLDDQAKDSPEPAQAGLSPTSHVSEPVEPGKAAAKTIIGDIASRLIGAVSRTRMTTPTQDPQPNQLNSSSATTGQTNAFDPNVDTVHGGSPATADNLPGTVIGEGSGAVAIASQVAAGTESSNQVVALNIVQADPELDSGVASAAVKDADKGIFLEAGLDAEMDQLFAKLAPPEAQQEVPPQLPVLEGKEEPVVALDVQSAQGTVFESGLDAEMDQIFAKLAPPEAQQEVQPRVPVLEEKEEPAVALDVPSGQGTVFEAGLDAEMDQIFAKLAPPEAQRQVGENVPLLEESPEPTLTPVGADHKNLFGGEVDSEVDQIFSALAPVEAQRVVAASSAEQVCEREEKSITADLGKNPPAHAGQGGLLAEGVNQEIDQIFAQLAPKEAQLNVGDKKPKEASDQTTEKPDALEELSFAPPLGEDNTDQSKAAVKKEVNVDAERSDQSETAKESEVDQSAISESSHVEIKDFGRLSTKATLGKAPSAPQGTMKTVGKLLVDVQAIENIIKGGETGKIGSGLATARVISAARGEGINALLANIDDYPGVSGSLIVGNDGLVIASTVVSGMDKDALGALSSALLHTSNLATVKLEIGKLGQMVLLTQFGEGVDSKMITTVLTDVEFGVLAVFLDTQQLNALDGLLETIEATVYG